ncbi:MAG: hypothetical protein M9900_09920 [Flavobacteriales bacterium]|nr:hypothetical protein [Flavobacteriales bacterium]
MAARKIKDEARELLGHGLPHQLAFDQLLAQYPQEKPKRIADRLRYMPSLAAKEKYRAEQRVLLALVVLSVLLSVWRAFNGLPDDLWGGIRLLRLVPFASLFLAYGVWHWHGQHVEWVGWMNILGAMGELKAVLAVADGSPLTAQLAGNVLSVAIGALALYLLHKAFPKYTKGKDPMTGAARYLFQERT